MVVNSPQVMETGLGFQRQVGLCCKVCLEERWSGEVV